ncbi:MAG TPA: VOC family protein [Polyangia bacterium]|jgi:catechol 2,3-dioxygenase-like lactoylglutathione lyase family enzyme
MDTLGLHHVGLAVSDLPATARFFTECLGWSIAREVPSYPAIFVTNGDAFVTLWKIPDDAAPFDRRKNVGMHHLAIRVASEAGLTNLFEKAKAHPGVVIDFAPEPQGGGPARHCMLFEPSGVRLEFIWKP